ncbi:hypothetical protein C8Q79DRAFT_468692 [Trametes meyenii]|nr:hypothetical protein C8Q79DRAFT_468692 [Trametes meyenii]
MTAPSATAAPNVSQGVPTSALATSSRLDNTLGAFLLGTYFGLMLYGMVIYQVYRYFRMYPNDVGLVKIWVVAILLVETAHTILCWHSCYYYLITNYHRPDILPYSVWSINMLPVITSITVGMSQGFFARRVYLISSKYRILVTISIILSIAVLGFSVAATSMGFVLNVYTTFSQFSWLDSAAFATTLVADSLTTTVLVITLKRSRTGITRTNRIVDRLILYAVNTGLLTSISNAVALILSIAQPDNMIYFGVCIVITKLYANSLLAVLNTRRDLAETGSSSTASATVPPPIGLSRIRGTATRLTRPAELWNMPQVSDGSRTAFELKICDDTIESTCVAY